MKVSIFSQMNDWVKLSSIEPVVEKTNLWTRIKKFFNIKKRGN